VKKAVYRILKKIRHDVACIDFNIFSILVSIDVRSRMVALKTVKLFWAFYEFDEVVVYSIRKHNMFCGLLKGNLKYRLAFAHLISRWEDRTARKDSSGHAVPKRINGTRAPRTGLYSSLASVGDARALKMHLEKHSADGTSDERIICSYFIEKLAYYTESSAELIPGLQQLRTDWAASEDKIDSALRLELLGLKTTRAYRAINRVFDRVTA
jgi:hypothetical protein